MKDLNLDEAVTTEIENDVLPLTVRQYSFFLAHGQAGREALAVYLHLIFTARLQNKNFSVGNNVWASNGYIANGVKMGQVKITKAKAFLHQAGMIEYRRIRGEDQKFERTYTVVKFVNPKKLSTSKGATAMATVGVETHTCGSERQIQGSNKLNTKIKKINTCRTPPGAPAAAPARHSEEEERTLSRLGYVKDKSGRMIPRWELEEAG